MASRKRNSGVSSGLSAYRSRKRQNCCVRAICSLEGECSFFNDVSYLNLEPAMKEHLFDLEAERHLTEADLPIYILYPDETGGNWRIQAVPISPDSFVSRKPLPAEWRGLRDSELSNTTDIPGGIFVHASGFIGGK